MPENDFLIVANSATNIESQSAFASDSVVANGVVSGTASSAQINKILRQATSGTAMLAQIMSGFGIAAVDSGNATTLATALLSAFASSGFLTNLGFGSGTGYLTMPWVVSGNKVTMILNYGTSSIAASSNLGITWPKPFTTSLLIGPLLTNQLTSASTPTYITGVGAPGPLTGATFYNTSNTGVASITWLAVGY